MRGIHSSSKSIQFYLTSSYACSYLPEERARSLVAAPSYLVTSQSYPALLENGFRRSGTFTYKPQCDQCQACMPIRLDTRRFSPSRNQRRTLKRFSHLQVYRRALAWQDDHYALYRQYQAARHSGSEMDNDDSSQFIDFLLTSHVNSYLLEFKDDAELVMVALVDEVPSGLSAVYTFFNPTISGLGTYGILWQAQYCQQKQLDWLYLGYWIEQSRKMAYKTQFTPYQLFSNGQWIAPVP